MKVPLARKATGNHPMKSTSLAKAQSLVSDFCYAQNRVCNVVNFTVGMTQIVYHCDGGAWREIARASIERDKPRPLPKQTIYLTKLDVTF